MMRAFGAGLCLLLLTSCAWLPAGKTPGDFPPKQASASVAPKSPSTPKSPSVRKARTREHVRRLLQQEEYAAALNAIGQSRQDDLSEEYMRAVSAIVALAGNELAAGEPARAGEYFRTALNHYPTAGSALLKRLPLSASGVETALGTCAEKQMEQGLRAYRAGRLAEAIDIWHRTLIFLPGHEPTRKAISTAQVQLDNLEALGDASGGAAGSGLIY